MRAPVARGARWRQAELLRRLRSAESAIDVFDATSDRLQRLVPFDAAAWFTNDPGTGLPTSPMRTEHLEDVSQPQCVEHWYREFVEHDVNLFRDLARADLPAAGLRSAAGEPERSRRFREFLRPLGFADELRTVLRSDGATWGGITLCRREGTEPFTAEDAVVLATLSTPIAEALRNHARPLEATTWVRRDEPGLIVFDGAVNVVSANDQARAWLAELPHDARAPTELGLEVPVWMIVVASRAQASSCWGDGTARTRVRSQRGQWLVCHASCLATTGGSASTTALVIEPANPAEVAPIIVEAFGLTAREQQVVQLIARGAGTAEISDTMHLSPHTVRDHVKATFAKAGVSSRGELVAKLYADFYQPAAEPPIRT